MNFALLLFLLTVLTGLMWLGERFRWRPRRQEEARSRVEDFDRANREALDRGEEAVLAARGQLVADALREPWWIDYTAGLFPVILAVFLLRSFLVEPFRIPSGSMLPTLQAGDFILVNKFQYGVRLPIVDLKIIELGAPRRGDVVVFHYPMDTSADYIKRVVGLPGDVVTYRDKVLSVNGVVQPQSEIGDWVSPDTLVTLRRRSERLGEVTHDIALDPRFGPAVRGGPYDRGREACRYARDGFECVVAPGHYFVMGDNRDNSEDSRYWGLVPDRFLVGRAFLIWANFSEPSRIGSFR